jgi:hypothetical protein
MEYIIVFLFTTLIMNGDSEMRFILTKFFNSFRLSGKFIVYRCSIVNPSVYKKEEEKKVM